MTPARQGEPGATRTCPHCRATILESDAVCPACRHHLRSGRATALRPRETFPAFTVQGTVRNPALADLCEYSVLVTVVDDAGGELARQVVSVGALRGAEVRSFTLAVQVHVPGPVR